MRTFAALVLLLSACAQAPRPLLEKSPFSAQAMSCGVPPKLPQALAADPDFVGARVVIVFKQRPTGEVSNVRVKSSSGYASLDESAVRAVEQWHCSLPGAPPEVVNVETPFDFLPSHRGP